MCTPKSTAAAQKVIVGALLLKAFTQGVVKEPVAIGGALDLLMAAVLFGVHMYRFGFAALRAAAGKTWFPPVVGLLQAGASSFLAPLLTGPLVALYLTGVLARRGLPRLLYAAVCNAIGAATGSAILLGVVDAFGVDAVKEAMPSIFASSTWEKASVSIADHGIAGAFFLCCLPVPLQPVVLVTALAGVNRASLLLVVFSGRCIKYLAMGALVLSGAKVLGFDPSAGKDAKKANKKK